MSKSLLQTRIIDKLEVIMTQVDTMNKFGKNIPIIHLDILKSNIRVLYEQICELERVQMQTEVGKYSHPRVASPVEEKRSYKTTEAEEKAIVDRASQVIAETVEAIQQEVEEEFANEEPIHLDTMEETRVKESRPVQELSLPLEMTVEVSPISPETIQESLQEEKIVVEEKEIPSFEMETTSLTFTFDETPAEEESCVREPVAMPVPDIFASLQTIADRYNNPESSLHGVMSATHVMTVNSSARSIRDLKAAIGVNEKFLFINDLFMGNMKEYTDTILALNDAEDATEVQAILTPLKSKYKWVEESIAHQTLMDFIHRRFA